ncbi:hypothetical protein DSM03_11711 [Leeuwenhoekiella aestuarii]|uniref:hypothetical protein n=1 Tax=Leeuwenhoekiella aestuarii TaxID=2249426 RepID=UPI000FFE3E86|nr:hypothetical protein [Leeuwenhoekiella aestuarii]RXG11374.1 hypothetical protein DSM03_11711 [Leeuwenhoekiella aestuarii]
MNKLLTIASVLIFLSLNKLNAQNNEFPNSGDTKIFQNATGFRAYDVINRNNHTVSRLEATTDGSGQLWLKDESGNYKVIIKSHSSIPSAISGELILGDFSSISKNRKLFVYGTAEFTGKLYGQSDVEIKQDVSGYRAFDVLNRNNKIVSRLEATTDASGQMWLKNQNGDLKVRLQSNASRPSFIAGEFVVGSAASTLRNKQFYVEGDSWLNGRLDVNGNLRTKEVKVEIFNGPDYVFESDYKLRELIEVEQYLKKYKHLPEVPSAKEMENDGIEVGKMNMLLLKKIEELTLYQIELLKRIEKLENTTK